MGSLIRRTLIGIGVIAVAPILFIGAVFIYIVAKDCLECDPI